MSSITNLERVKQQKRLEKEQQLIPINREIAALEMELSTLKLKRKRMEKELLGLEYHNQQELIRAARNLVWREDDG